MKKILTIIFIFTSLFASSQELMNKNLEGFRVKVSELVIDNDTLNMSGTGGIEANSIDVDTMKIDGVPLLLNAFKKDSLGGAGNIFYSTGASSQPASGSVNQVLGGGLLTDKYLIRWDGRKLANSNIYQDANGNIGIGTATPTTKLDIIYNGVPSTSGNMNTGMVISSGPLSAALNIGVYNNGNPGSYGWISSAFNNSAGVYQYLALQPNGGNVGIGTITPLSKLSINGGLHVGGDSDAGDNNILADGTITGTQLISNISTGTPPLVVASTTKVDSLNVDLLDGKHASDFLKYTDPVIESDTIKVRADIIVTGEIYDEINHLYGMVYDSTITLSLAQNVWQQVTNPTKTLYSTAEQNGVTISGDTIVFSKAGGYDVYFEINCTGIDSKDYHYRILQKNGTTTVRSYNKYSSTGTQVIRNEKAYVHVAAGSKVWCEIMSPSSAPGNVTIQGAKIYAMQRYLEK